MGLDDREKAFEDKFALDEELQFKIRARANKQLGIWAAQKMGKNQAEAEGYTTQLVKAMLDKDKLLARLKKDFADSGVTISEAELITNLDSFTSAARKYFMGQK